MKNELAASMHRAGAAAAGQEIEHWVERFARLGYAAKGVVYLIVGGLAAAAAVGSGGATTGSQGAFRTLLRQPFGRVLLGLVALGLACYAAWRFVQAVRDPEMLGDDAKGWAKRAFIFGSGCVHVALVVAAVRLMLGNGGGGTGAGGAAARTGTAKLMSAPFGRWLVALVGLGIVAIGVAQLVRAWRESYARRLHLGELPIAVRRWVGRSARFGLTARGVVFGMIGGFLVAAAVQANPSEAKGLGDALRSLEARRSGPGCSASSPSA